MAFGFIGGLLRHIRLLLRSLPDEQSLQLYDNRRSVCGLTIARHSERVGLGNRVRTLCHDDDRNECQQLEPSQAMRQFHIAAVSCRNRGCIPTTNIAAVGLLYMGASSSISFKTV